MHRSALRSVADPAHSHGLHPLAFNCSLAFRKKLKSKKSVGRNSFFRSAARRASSITACRTLSSAVPSRVITLMLTGDLERRFRVRPESGLYVQFFSPLPFRASFITSVQPAHHRRIASETLAELLGHHFLLLGAVCHSSTIRSVRR